jgi:hypothetical protein
MLGGDLVMSPPAVVRSALGLLLLACSGCGASAPAAESADSELAPASSTRKGTPVPKDELTASQVVIKLRGNETDIRRCFFANPSARGSLSLSWNVNRDGRIERLKRERSTLSDPRIEQCLSEKLYDVRFDPREKPAHAGWTFVFRLVEPVKDRSGRIKQRNKRERARAEDADRGVELEKGSPGSLDLAAVDDVVESGFPLFARCYRDGVQRNSNLDGAVRLRFVVGGSGHVTMVEDGGSDLTDRQVIDCVAEGFYALRFPEPQRGDAHLVYRIHFGTA